MPDSLMQAGKMSLSSSLFVLEPYQTDTVSSLRLKKMDIRFLINRVGELLLSPSAASSCLLITMTPYPVTNSICTVTVRAMSKTAYVFTEHALHSKGSVSKESCIAGQELL